MENNYNVGESYPFKVRNVFDGYCELVDERNGIRTYLPNTGNLKLYKSQIVNCRVIGIKEKKPLVDLVDLTDIITRKDAKINDAMLTAMLEGRKVEWNTRDFIRLMLAKENDTSFESQAHKWIQTQISLESDLRQIQTDCFHILEYSSLLDTCSSPEREFYQDRFTLLIELLGAYIQAQELIANDSAEEAATTSGTFVEDVLKKLTRSGYIFHPQEHFNILSCLFLLKPQLMYDNMDKVFEVIRKRNLVQWKREPFRSALIKVLDLYVTGYANKIDKERDNERIVKKAIEALGIQLLLMNTNEDSDVADFRLSSARICTIASYCRMANSLEIVNMGLNNLLGSKVALPAYNLASDPKMLPFFISDEAHKQRWELDTVNIFQPRRIKLTVRPGSISLTDCSGEEESKEMLPSDLKLWMGMQVNLDKRSAPVQLSSASKDIFRYKRLWDDIEQEFFGTTTTTLANSSSRHRHKVTETVRISVLRQDMHNINMFHCRIEDKLGGEGYIMLSDIVGYTGNITVRNFLSESGNRLVFKARIIEFEDGMFHFSIREDLQEFAQSLYEQEPDNIICNIGMNQTTSLPSTRLPGITVEGVDVSLRGLEEFHGLKKNDLVSATYEGPGPDNFSISAIVRSKLDYGEFDLCESFQFLMRQYACDEIVEQDNGRTEGIMEGDSIMNTATVRELVYMIDRIAILEGEYIKSYNYLAFDRIICLMAGWERQASYYKGRMDIILQLHDFAINDRVDEQALDELAGVNADLFEGNPQLADTFRQLQTVSFIGKPEHNADLWELTASDSPIIREVAGLVLSYNFMKQNQMLPQAIDVQNRIKNTLRLKGMETGLKLYGKGVEDKTTEYKTSIVYLGNGKIEAPQYEKQMHQILCVIDSFLNTEGGTLYLGVNDRGMGVGLEEDLKYPDFSGDIDRYARRIIDCVVRMWGKVVATYVDVDVDTAGDKQVCIVSVKPFATGVSFDGAWYVRVGSTKRPMTKEEFDSFNTNSRNTDVLDSNATETAAAEEDAVRTEAPQTILPETKPAPLIGDYIFKDNIPTSHIRCNTLYDDGISDYRPTVGFLQFLDKGKFRKLSDYNWDDHLLTLAVYNEEAEEGHLILVYEDCYVAKVPVSKLLGYRDNASYARYDHAKLVFASIATDDDALFWVTQEEKTQSRLMARADHISHLDETKLTDHGQRVYNEGIGKTVLYAEIIPAEHVAQMDDILDVGPKTIGKPLKTLHSTITGKLDELHISEDIEKL